MVEPSAGDVIETVPRDGSPPSLPPQAATKEPRAKTANTFFMVALYGRGSEGSAHESRVKGEANRGWPASRKRRSDLVRRFRILPGQPRNQRMDDKGLDYLPGRLFVPFRLIFLCFWRPWAVHL